jgi:hypothetical protein
MKSLNIESLELKDVLRSLADQVESGVDIETRNITEPIIVEIEVTVEKETEGGFKFSVASLGGVGAGKTSGNTSQIKLSFAFQPKQSEREKREISEAVAHNEAEAEKWRNVY